MKKTYRLLFALTALIFTASCTPEVEDAFDKPSPDRIAEAISETKDILTAAPNGWKMAYQGSGGFGGFNILCKFDKKDNVFCEEESDHAKATSHYTVQQGQGVLLSFDSFNAALHKYSDPVGKINGKSVGKDGKGFQGDFEFRVMSCTKDSIVLEGRKHGDRVVMTPMPEDLTWDSFFTQIATVASGMSSERYNIIIDKDTLPARMNLHTLHTTDKNGKAVAIPFIYTPQGIEVLKADSLNGRKLTAFTYSTDDKWVDPNDKSVMLSPRDITPLEAFFSDNWTINVGYSSTAEMNVWKAAAAYAASKNMEIVTVYFSTTPGFLSLSSYVGDNWGNLRTLYSTSGKDQITIKGFRPNPKGTANERNGAVFYNQYKLKDIANTFLVNGQATDYTLSIDNPKHPLWLRMTSNSHDEVSFVFYRGIWSADF
ncbi:conserved domain protein [Prevotella denticola CRIS 18C-A]|uniref:Conserved domain protein n=1 Tax=Prevotella denticola CRIS 18C-A TaxID=944557 RepID=F0H7T3_9BACT|nr:DUF4302 domain-containing protein [Prevotella denticola]EGC86096.1 conserved domain protein [Prevotella denticola CRIS 18C-A]MBW4713900.1 DUF4302 domain-containing protein [Prevotella denticola]MBW4751794.1 DUF4302 domain-containing protein [Prevotella denticola]